MIQRLLNDERGMTLIEVMMVSALLLMVLGAAMAPFDVLHKTERRTVNQNESQDSARNAMAVITRDLRNTSGQNQLINLANPYDMVIETVDPTSKPAGSQNARNLMRVRYCLDTTSSGASLIRGKLWQQNFKWTTAAPPSTMPSAACPDTAWGTSQVLADHVTNKATASTGGQGSKRTAQASMFTYFPNASSLDTITSIKVSLYTDRAWTEAPVESELSSGILLRNQNGGPTASFTATPGAAGSFKITLNANTSTDPEGLPLTFRWCDVTTVTLCDDTTRIGTSVLYTYTAPAAGARKIQLQVFDVGGLQATAGPLTVTAP
jgi:prepilin-type N-terminal cleavage/methylation domain-containing protein